jgi:hypothetical protein
VRCRATTGVACYGPSMEDVMAQKKRARDKLTVELGHDLRSAVEHWAEAADRPIAYVVRRLIVAEAERRAGAVGPERAADARERTMEG